MKIVVYGAGVMANYVKEAIINSGNEFLGFVDPLGKGNFDTLKNKDIDYDAIIDFSHFSLLEEILEIAEKKKVPLLIATTGHNREATNTSIGVNILNEITAYATKLLKGFDIEVIEKHHNRKIDAPSGTANTLVEIINKNLAEEYEEEYKIVYGREGNSKRTEKEIGVHSIRAGNIVGEHTVIYSKNDEIIEIKHEALSRKIFADGAIKAILYLKNQKAGLYTMKDVLNIK